MRNKKSIQKQIDIHICVLKSTYLRRCEVENNCVSHIRRYRTRILLLDFRNLYRISPTTLYLALYRSSILSWNLPAKYSLAKHRKLYAHPNPLVSENLLNHSAFTIGRTFLLYFPETNHNERPNKKRKTIGMTIEL